MSCPASRNIMIEAVRRRTRQLFRLGTYYLRYFNFGAAANGNRSRNIHQIAELTPAGQCLQKTDLRSRWTEFVGDAEPLGRGDDRMKGRYATEPSPKSPAYRARTA